MKNMKKIIAVLMSLTAIASTTAMAATEATYEDGKASLVLAENEITAAANDQLTVVIVPTTATEITSENIYYINQGAFEAEFTAILADMKVKDGFGDAKDYEVRIGGVVEGDKYVVKTFNFAVEEEEIVVKYGDVDDSGAIDTADAVTLAQYLANWGNKINEEAADVVYDSKIDTSDAVALAQYLANWGNVLGPQK